jgi:hypothetical protein
MDVRVVLFASFLLSAVIGTRARAQIYELPELRKPYKDPMHDNDFSYLDDPDYVSTDHFDRLKRMPLPWCSTLDVGGEYRMRYHHEYNRRLRGNSNDFLLQRARLYGDLRYQDRVRVYVEYIDAISELERLPTRGVDENRSDIPALFAELLLWEDCCGRQLSIRGGRQHILYGAERLMTPSWWANVTSPYDGITMLYKSDTWDINGFWVRPIQLSQHVNNDHNFDSPDQSQQGAGVYATWHGIEDHKVDLFFLWREEADAAVMAEDGTRGGFDFSTIGARWDARYCDWLWEIEGGYQFGDFSVDDHSAGYLTVMGGYEFSCLLWKPALRVYYDWASGDRDPNDGSHGTFDQWFYPQSHQYLGLFDVIGRKNVDAWNFRLTAKPHDRITLRVSYHIFHLDEDRDALYNNGAIPVRRDATGASGSDVGKEIDVTAHAQLTQHASFLFGYSHLFSGDFLAATGNGDDGRFAYSMFLYRF